jgi:competence protein ComEC
VFTGWRLPAELAGWLLDLSREVVDWHARWEPAWRVPNPPLWLGVCLSASLILLGALRGRRRLPALATAVFFTLLVWHPFPPRVRPGALEVTAIDVGQGDALFIAFPDGRLMLLDAGGFPSFDGRQSSIDTGEDVVSPYLWTRSIKRLDVVAVSHLHEDHAGGVPSILRNFHPKEVWTGLLPESPEAARLREIVRASGARLQSMTAGDEFGYGRAALAILAPRPEDVISAKAGDRASLVFRLRYGRRSVIFTGDMDPGVERALAEQGAFGHYDVLKVPHHGSRNSTGDLMLEEVRPTFALISVGYANAYNHPHPDLLDRLRRGRATPLRTDVLGLVSVLTDGSRLEVNTGRLTGALR